LLRDSPRLLRGTMYGRTALRFRLTDGGPGAGWTGADSTRMSASSQLIGALTATCIRFMADPSSVSPPPAPGEPPLAFEVAGNPEPSPTSPGTHPPARRRELPVEEGGDEGVGR